MYTLQYVRNAGDFFLNCVQAQVVYLLFLFKAQYAFQVATNCQWGTLEVWQFEAAIFYLLPE